jgi:uncharacterized protein YdeI (YjbR/CyaY-like superfamily)
MAPVIPNPDKLRHFPHQAAFETWLAANHERETEIWLKIHKKGSGLPTVTYAEALDVALCWGWIDGIRKSFDDKTFLQRFTPRRPKSIWSQINREHVERLTAQGRMTPHGQEQIDAAQSDGRWQAAYASGSKMEFPADLRAAIEAEPKARKFFGTLNATNRYALAFRTMNMKTQAGREKRIKSFVDMLKRGETLYPNGKEARKGG